MLQHILSINVYFQEAAFDSRVWRGLMAQRVPHDAALLHMVIARIRCFTPPQMLRLTARLNTLNFIKILSLANMGCIVKLCWWPDILKEVGISVKIINKSFIAKSCFWIISCDKKFFLFYPLLNILIGNGCRLHTPASNKSEHADYFIYSF